MECWASIHSTQLEHSRQFYMPAALYIPPDTLVLISVRGRVDPMANYSREREQVT